MAFPAWRSCGWDEILSAFSIEGTTKLRNLVSRARRVSCVAPNVTGGKRKRCGCHYAWPASLPHLTSWPYPNRKADPHRICSPKLFLNGMEAGCAIICCILMLCGCSNSCWVVPSADGSAPRSDSLLGGKKTRPTNPRRACACVCVCVCVCACVRCGARVLSTN